MKIQGRPVTNLRPKSNIVPPLIYRVRIEPLVLQFWRYLRSLPGFEARLYKSRDNHLGGVV